MNRIEPDEIERGMTWLISFRALFAIVLAFSTLIFSTNEHLPVDSEPFVAIYVVALALLVLSIVYGFLYHIVKKIYLLSYFQLIVDSVAVTVIIYITGSFNSIFTFLYLVVIIASSMLLLRKGSMIIATCCSLQYGILIDLEYYGIIKPLLVSPPLSHQVAWTHIIYRIIIIMAACFAVAVLSGFLAFQTRKAKKDLRRMQDHVKRVERMAAMGEIAAGMAHEIKNPLASLSGAIQMLKEDAAPGTSNHRLMTIVLRETERLSRLVTDFLLFARPRAMAIHSVCIADEIKDMIEMFQKAQPCQDRIAVSTMLDPEITLLMDPDHFRQILWNLLKNAADAIDDSGRIDIVLRKSRSDKIVLVVSDDGCGIAPENIDAVFNPFFTTKSHGTGLGLSIVYRMIDFYQGIVDIESEEDVGTTVTVVFKGDWHPSDVSEGNAQHSADA